VPTYQYACTACDHRFDAVQSFSDASLTECPACGGKLRKLYGSVGVVFKGSGFYRTDSRSEATTEATTAAKTDKPAEKPAAAATPAKKDAPSTSSGSSGSSSSSGGSATKVAS
jgi:putative FmdB family regulatory protein